MRKISGKGSFRGVPFFIEEQQDISGGRRLVQFEYPLRDDGLTEDLGLRLRQYHVNCLVIGDDYIKQAEKLIDALEKADEGELNHPYFGKKTVRVEDYKTTYSTSEQRIARFEITFIPAINAIAPLANKDSLFAALSQYAQALNVLADEFASIIEEALDLLDELTAPIFELVNAFVGLIETVFEGMNTLTDTGMAFKNHLMSFKGRLTTLIRVPKLLAKELQALVKLGAEGIQHAPKAIEMKRVFVRLIAMQANVKTHQAKLQQTYPELGRTALSGLTKSLQQHQPINLALTRSLGTQSKQNVVELLQAKTQFTFLRLMQTIFVLEYGHAIMQAVSLSRSVRNATGNISSAIESKADVQRYMAEIDTQLDALIFDLADNEQWQGYEVLEQYRLALLTDLRTRGELLAHSQIITLKDTQPALVVEFNANGNANGWEKLTLRNHIRHPLFCLGGTDIEVLQ